ncbi:MAG: heavy metal transporter [Bacteroidetes bacterium]|nr:heavy metal transporter [Bacteroidota bacterium]
MAKIVRPTYPLELSVGVLLLIFVLSLFLSSQLFDVPWRELLDARHFFAMSLVSTAVVIMAVILWEEILFPIKIVPTRDQVTFRNHQTKLKTQLIIYLAIPLIFGFIYFSYEVNHVRFFIWALVCLGAPIAGKLHSGIKNYNDFLKLTYHSISYKNNDAEGVFLLKDIQRITLIKDENKVLHKFMLLMEDTSEVTIDLDEMELEPFYESIDKAMYAHYKNLVTEVQRAAE